MKEGVIKMAEDVVISDMEKDAIGEIMNISMGSAATALSSMFDKKVTITTPRVSYEPIVSKSYVDLSPSLLVSITYCEGLTGANAIVFKQSDIQLLLNALMGIDTLSEDFEFDEISISAACEVMNQMMGASSTSLSSFLGRTINITPPQATVLENNANIKSLLGIDENEKVVSVFFDLCIEGMLESEFASIMSIELAKELFSSVMGLGAEEEVIEEQPAPVAQQAPPPPPPAPEPVAQAPQAPVAQQAPPPQAPQAPQAQAPQMPYTPDGYGQVPYGYPPQMPYGYPPQMPYGYPPQMQQMPQQPPQPTIRQSIDVKPVQMPDFAHQAPSGVPLGEDGSNLNLIMNVPLSISVELGKAKKKIRDIMDFSQGTVLELEKQAGAPVDVVVNGQLIARGDVVVIDDNFGVRITEILGTKDILNSLENKE